jgi:hypothetical protein
VALLISRFWALHTRTQTGFSDSFRAPSLLRVRLLHLISIRNGHVPRKLTADFLYSAVVFNPRQEEGNEGRRERIPYNVAFLLFFFSLFQSKLASWFIFSLSGINLLFFPYWV